MFHSGCLGRLVGQVTVESSAPFPSSFAAPVFGWLVVVGVESFISDRACNFTGMGSAAQLIRDCLVFGCEVAEVVGAVVVGPLFESVGEVVAARFEPVEWHGAQCAR